MQGRAGTSFVACRAPRTMGCAPDSRAPSNGWADPRRRLRTGPVQGRHVRLDRTLMRPGHRSVMPSTSIPPASPADVRPVRADLRELATARQVIADLAHPDTRHIVDTALGTLHAALSGGGLQVSKIPGLQQAIRKHVRQAWMDGVIAPLARSRHPADRAVLDALPQAFALNAHAEVASALERIGRWIPAEAAGTRDHVARAGAYLRTLPLILRALADLEAATPMAGRAGGPTPDDVGADLAAAAAMARRQLKAALARGLPALVDGLADAVYRVPLRASDAPALRWTASALLAPPVRGARRSDRGAPQWRRGLATALSRDLVDEALAPAAGRMLGRHVGLEVGAASFAKGGDHAGQLDIALSRGGVRLSLSARFDIGAGLFEHAAAIVTPEGGLRPLALTDVDALLDAAVPAAWIPPPIA